jgi:hypothetical protein
MVWNVESLLVQGSVAFVIRESSARMKGNVYRTACGIVRGSSVVPTVVVANVVHAWATMRSVHLRVYVWAPMNAYPTAKAKCAVTTAVVAHVGDAVMVFYAPPRTPVAMNAPNVASARPV